MILKGLNQDECIQWLQLALGNESPCCTTVFRWFKEFCSGRNSLLDEEHTGRPQLAVITDNVSTIRKMFIDDNHCTYQMIQKEVLSVSFDRYSNYHWICSHT
ncbi:UNVERIFIED_CONTAM: hypothetical protein NCL1_42463 [Trichonephila clavipes]